MKKKRGSGPSDRTPAQRAAIDARADAYPRPLSEKQVQALKIMAHATFSYAHRERAGWSLVTLRPWISTLFAGATIDALFRRGLVARSFNLAITAAGRREAARHQ